MIKSVKASSSSFFSKEPFRLLFSCAFLFEIDASAVDFCGRKEDSSS